MTTEFDPSTKLPPEWALKELEGVEGVEPEETGDENTNGLPWDPSKIRISTRYVSLREVIEDIDARIIDLSPDFQRDYVWKKRQRTKLVESILLGIPLPAFYFNQDNESAYQVVDGVQRLSTIKLFMEDGHVLDISDLEYLKNLHGFKCSDLLPVDLRRFRTTQIVVHIIEPQTPDEVKYDIFNRVNTLGEPLSTQEIRHAMSRNKSRRFLKDLSELQVFDIATAWNYWGYDDKKIRVRKSVRMANRELVLRFCAFRHYTSDEYRQFSSLNAFLVDFTRRIDGRDAKGSALNDDDLLKLRTDFERAMKNAQFILGSNAFRKVIVNSTRRSPISRAIFESQAVALADYKLSELSGKEHLIGEAFRSAFDDPSYLKAVTEGTGTAAAVHHRIEVMKARLAEALQ